GGAQPPRVPNRRAAPGIITGRKRACDIIGMPRGNAQPDHIDGQFLAFSPHRVRQPRRSERNDPGGQLLGDARLGSGRSHGRGQLLRRRMPKPNPGMRLTSTTMAKVIASIMRPSTAMAPRSPLSLRSKISTETTLVSEVKSMIAADSSRMTPTKMKHQVAITPVRSKGAVT